MKEVFAPLPERVFDDIYEIGNHAAWHAANTHDFEWGINILTFGWFKFTDEKVDAERFEKASARVLNSGYFYTSLVNEIKECAFNIAHYRANEARYGPDSE